MNKHAITVLAILLICLSACCSPKEQIDLGIDPEPIYLPDDILLIDGVPQVVSVSSESDGDVVVYYINTDDNLIGQVYGCYMWSVGCTKYHELGKQTFLLPKGD